MIEVLKLNRQSLVHVPNLIDGHFLTPGVTADADTHASVTGIYTRDPFGIRPIELYDDWRTELSSDRIVEMIGIDLPQTWAFEYFTYTRPELLHTDLGLGLVPSAWRWYRTNLHTAEIGPLTARLQSWIQADPDFQRSDALSRRRVVLSHPILRRYYLGERVDIQVRGCRSVPYSPPEDMRAGKQMALTAAHTEGIPHVEFIMGGDYDEFCRISLMQSIGSRLDDFQGPAPSQPLGTHLANLRLPYSIPYYLPDSPPAFREVSLESVDRPTLLSEDITEVPVGLVNQMMELVLGMQQELTTAWTQLAFDDQRRRRPRR
ncbi:hypothetical protein JCGZ_03568 [Jatropha curcas]|uniref:Aminotransferase-like plant mobile domain-containing protein n=1 Tax=Jatropha curcas TaxID=180498 RepID=A0A067KXU4_JATCU|nr:hypothetical protein JCGZ_03568 [Jatropha curcas]